MNGLYLHQAVFNVRESKYTFVCGSMTEWYQELTINLERTEKTPLMRIYVTNGMSNNTIESQKIADSILKQNDEIAKFLVDLGNKQKNDSEGALHFPSNLLIEMPYLVFLY